MRVQQIEANTNVAEQLTILALYWLCSFTAQHIAFYIGFILVSRPCAQSVVLYWFYTTFTRNQNHIVLPCILITYPHMSAVDHVRRHDATLIPEFVTPLSRVRDLGLELELTVSLHQTVVTRTVGRASACNQPIIKAAAWWFFHEEKEIRDVSQIKTDSR